ncbi:unnamed protein product [Thlaspi arvense]|uniref:Thioredoxin-like fold domain-containing protein n=1 Tax=Thlaspi arvense TaxID=13288 RepID=A0AAU9SKT6_THLAR|nr:unnamed protein product [Thlaspi arvense]
MEFIVVGVHSAKFDNEKDLEAIRNAVLRYGISHPVVNDGEMYLWRELGVNSWPTFAIVGPMVNSLHKYQVKAIERSSSSVLWWKEYVGQETHSFEFGEG